MKILDKLFKPQPVTLEIPWTTREEAREWLQAIFPGQDFYGPYTDAGYIESVALVRANILAL